jgi:hypothetical protein
MYVRDRKAPPMAATNPDFPQERLTYVSLAFELLIGAEPGASAKITRRRVTRKCKASCEMEDPFHCNGSRKSS